jgi:hypothetical protein
MISNAFSMALSFLVSAGFAGAVFCVTGMILSVGLFYRLKHRFI